jgi:hypothetical protein
MADNDNRKFDLPWATLLPLVAVLAGVVAQFKPLVSTRPAVAKEKAIPVIAEQDVDARLWQDPISVAQKQKSSLDEQIAAGAAKKGAEESHKISALRAHLHKRLEKAPENILLLAVMIEAGPYSEQGESRLRARPAVLEALSESGFAPLDGEHIGFVTADWPPPNDFSGAPTMERALLLPWEECIAKDPPHAHPKDTRWLVVLWLPAASFNPNPLSRFANIVDQLAGDIREKVDIRLIGPANSTGLQSMVREVRQRSGPPENTKEGLPQNTKDTLNGISIFSPRATASDEWLLFRPKSAGGGTEVRSASTKNTVQALVEEAAPGLKFVRTIAPDDLVLKNLIAELARRRVPVVQQTTPDGRPISKVAHIVILSEWDTPYGRSLSTIFAAQASGRTVSEIVEHPDKWPSWVHPYRYLRGIDGQLPGDEPKEGQRDQVQKTQLGQDTVAIEATEGMNQSDYLRRLARQMKEDNSRWQRDDGLGIRAIGLLGSDIYDKLMILRALRPQFRDAVFFTNNYDAHFERRDDWDDTRNLIIASPFGSALPETFSRQHIAPFRDTNQTATYMGTLVATGGMTPEEAEYLSWQPRIFEISRHGAYDLSDPWYLEGKSLSVSNKSWFRDWLFAPGVIWLLIVIALTVLATAAWISLSIARRTLPGGGTALERLKRALVSTTFWLVCGGPLIVFMVALIAQYWGPEEPLIFFSGISIWPTEMLRLIAFLLAIFFMFKANFDLRANAKKIEGEFSFTPLPLTRFRWRHLGIGFEHWRMRDPARTSRFSAEEAWHTYLCRSKFWPRFIRVGVLFALYFVFSAAIFSLFPQPPAPGRGEASFRFDKIAFILGGVGSLLLSFYVVDAIQLNSNFIRMFAREVTKWGRGVIDRSHRSPPLTEKELSAYHEIFFVAQRTQAVAPLIWYPLLVLTLLVIARSSFFDNWTWPASLVLIFAITAAWALGSAILLRRAAEQLRETALSDLRRFRLLGRETEAKREMFDELITEIRDLKTGAFAPLTEQSFIRAVLFPGAGLGLLAVGQRLLDLF